MLPPLRIAMLLTDAFGGHGGVAQFNRDLLWALDACPLVERIHALPRLICEPIAEPIPESVVFDLAAAGGKFAFARRALGQMWRIPDINLVICGHLHLLPVAWAWARRRRARLALVIHGIDAWTPSRHPSANRLTGAVDDVLAAGRYSARLFGGWSGVPLERCFVLPNCVDLDRFRPAPPEPGLVARYGLQDARVLLTVARLAPEERYKGIDEVIELMPRLLDRFPSLKYLVVGDGADRPRLAAKAKASGVGAHVVFAGWVADAEKVAHYNLADAFVMPSSGEGFGIVYIEAAACGVPVIGGAAGGAVEALLDGRLGRLVDRTDPAALAQAIVATLESGDRGTRNPLVKTFGVDAHRARVDDWCRRQVAAIAAAQSRS
jgi:glycosyltransferase involved in cell wall biosynthesis